MLAVGRETGSASSAREHIGLKCNSEGAVTSLRSGRKGLCLCAPSAPSRPGRALDGPLLISGKGIERLDFFSQMVQRFPGPFVQLALSPQQRPAATSLCLTHSREAGPQAAGPSCTRLLAHSGEGVPPLPHACLAASRGVRERQKDGVGRGDQMLLSCSQWAPLTFAVGCFS